MPGVAATESPVSAISWAAIIGGAFAIASISLILLALGAGLGFASVSPWSSTGASATTFTVAAAIWLLVVQWLSAAFGGYLTGRLRTKWVSVHSDEVYFRDTAHGFFATAVAAVVTAVVLASAVRRVIGGAARLARHRARATAAARAGRDRRQRRRRSIRPRIWSTSCSAATIPDVNANSQPARAEAMPIIARGLTRAACRPPTKPI